MHDTVHPRLSGYLLPVLIGAASLAGILAAAGIALMGDFSMRSTAAAIFYGVGTLAALMGIIWSSTSAGRLAVLTGVTAGTAVVVLLGILSFGPLFVPALVLWGLGGMAMRQEESRPARLLVVTGALWGIGLVLVGSVAIPLIVG